MTDVWHLQDLDWLRELAPEEREKLRSASVHRRFDAGETVFAPVPHPSSVYLLEEGLVRIYRLSEEGLETTLGYVQPGEVFGELPAFGDYPRESFAQSVEPSSVWKIPRQVFQRLVASRPGPSFGVSKQIGARLKRIESRVANLVFRDVRERVMLTLIELIEHFGVRHPDGSIELDVRLTQAELATLVGSTRQSVNAALGELSEQQLIGRRGRHITLLDPDELHRAAAGPPGGAQPASDSSTAWAAARRAIGTRKGEQET